MVGTRDSLEEAPLMAGHPPDETAPDDPLPSPGAENAENAENAGHAGHAGNADGRFGPAGGSSSSSAASPPGRRGVARSWTVPPSSLSGSLLQRNQWIALAVASGACAACNGVFAKLTTTELTSRFAQWVASLLHLGSLETPVEVVVRGTFFALNLVFNGVMWTLFTKALKVAHSSTQVSVLNTSTNFMLTALLGLAIFSEALPPLWWVGAAMLVAGNVIIGQKDEGAETKENEGDEEDQHHHHQQREGEGEEAGEAMELETEAGSDTETAALVDDTATNTTTTTTTTTTTRAFTSTSAASSSSTGGNRLLLSTADKGKAD